MKLCCRCSQNKPISEFGKRTRNRDGLEFFCKSCSKVEKDRYADRRRELDRERYHNSREYYVAKSSKTQYKKRGNPLPEKYSATLESVKKKHTPVITYKDVLLRIRDYKRSNPELMKSKYKKWSSTDNGKLTNSLKSQRRRAREKELPNTLTKQEVLSILDSQAGKCAGCQLEFSPLHRYEIDHIVPVSLGGGLTKDNVQLLCRSCNASKGAKVIRFIKESTHYKYSVNGE